MKTNALLFSVYILILNLHYATCFLGHQDRRQQFHSERAPNATPDNHLKLRCSSSSSPSSLSLSQGNTIYLVKWDGCFVDTVDWRIQLGIQAAAAVWPQVEEQLSSWDDTSWLENKLAALSHVLSSSSSSYKNNGDENNNTVSVTCEYALATRLLLEEQQLDEGRSIGKSGKYASKFHPSGTTQTEGRIRRNSQRITGCSSRPLTVGEIAANWNDMIRETLPTRYHCNYQNPMPILQDKIEQLLHNKVDQTLPFLVVNQAIVEAFSSFCNGKLVLTVCHSSDLPVAEATLTQASLPFQTVQTFDSESNQHFDPNMITLLETSENTVQELLQAAPEGTTVFVIESSWPTLKKMARLFGDNIPRQGDIGKSMFPGKWLSLCLAGWARNSHASQHAAATMNPWTGLMDSVEFSELISGKIVTRN